MNTDKRIERAVRAAYTELRRQADESHRSYVGDFDELDTVVDGHFDLRSLVLVALNVVLRDE